MKVGLLVMFFTFVAFPYFSQEICDNGIDDDLDGLIDLQDTTNCFCQLAELDSSIASLIPNPSFEQRSCCPSAASQLNCVNDWIQATGATPDYLNTCNLTSVGTFPVPPTPLPDGVGYIGFFDDYFPSANSIIYKEYIGACLNDTMKIGKNYQLDFYLANSFGSLTTELAIYGTTDCANLPFGSLLNTPTSLCPTTVAPADWTLLDIDTVTCSSSSWVKGTLNFMPSQNYTAIVIGPSCNNNATGANYYYLDNLILNEISSFSPKVGIKDSGNYCQNNLMLEAVFDSIPLTFQWYKDSIAIVGATDSTYSVPNGQTGNYQLVVTYNSLCVLTEAFSVDTTIISFNLDSSGTCLLGNQLGEIRVLKPQGGTTPYEYQLGISGFVSDSIFRNLSAGIYSVTVQDSNGCKALQTIQVDTFSSPIASFSADSVCLGQATSFTDQSTISSGSILTYQWSLPVNPSTPNATFTFPTDGTFPVTLTVVSDSGCIDVTSVVVVVNPLPEVSFTFSPSELYTFNPEVCFTNQSVGASSYLWDFDFTGTDGTSTLIDPCIVRFPIIEGRNYQVTLVAETNKGCRDSAKRTLAILDEFLCYIPNAFSPNEDGINDEFEIVTAGVESYTFSLFNRWGEVVFQSTNTSEKWDGTYNGAKSSQGVYVYRVVVRGQNGVLKEQTGHVSLLR